MLWGQNHPHSAREEIRPEKEQWGGGWKQWGGGHRVDKILKRGVGNVGGSS